MTTQEISRNGFWGARTLPANVAGEFASDGFPRGSVKRLVRCQNSVLPRRDDFCIKCALPNSGEQIQGGFPLTLQNHSERVCILGMVNI